MERISRDQMFIEIARIVAKRGTCDRAYVGAVMTCDNRIISIGYNGAPSGQPHCDEVGHKLVNNHCTNATHAEINCLEFALPRLKQKGLNICTLYVTTEPCWECIYSICTMMFSNPVHFQLDKIIYEQSYNPDPRKTEYLKKWGVELVQYTE
jgi:dCMP deaminase